VQRNAIGPFELTEDVGLVLIYVMLAAPPALRST